MEIGSNRFTALICLVPLPSLAVTSVNRVETERVTTINKNRLQAMELVGEKPVRLHLAVIMLVRLSKR